jgi:uncharacterized caspase-like protein
MATLLSTHGFKATLLLDPTGQQLHDAMQIFVSKCSGRNKIVVYISGHGVHDTKDNFLLPKDFSSRQPGGIREERKLAIFADIVVPLQSANSRGINVIIADMCRDIFQAKGVRGNQGVDFGFIKPKSLPSGTLVAFACERGQKSYASTAESGHSLYTQILMRHLAEQQDILKVIGFVNTEVQELTKLATAPMEPWCESNIKRNDFNDIILIAKDQVYL